MPKPLRTAFLTVLLLAIAAVALTACGGGSGSGDDAKSLLKETFSGKHEITSGKAVVSLSANIKGSSEFEGPLRLSVSGPFQGHGDDPPEFKLDVTAGAAGQSFSGGLTSAGNAGFVGFQGSEYKVPDKFYSQFADAWRKSKQQKSSAAAKDSGSLESLGLDPLSWFGDAEVVGDEEVGGTETTHVSATVDTKALLDDLSGAVVELEDQLPKQASDSGSISESDRQQIEKAISAAKFDVWTGKDDKTLRKAQLRFTIDIPQAQRSQLGGASSATIDLSFQINDLNKPQQVSAPSGAKPLQDLINQFKGMLGGLGGDLGEGSAGSGGSSGGSAPGGAGADKVQAYTKCLQQAGGDVSKAQKCADLLAG